MLKNLFKILKRKNQEIGICSICDNNFLETELQEIDSLFLCPSDFKFYKDHKWHISDSGESSPEKPELALKIQNKKDQLKKQGIKSFILVSYKEKNGNIISIFDLYTHK